MHPSLFAPVYLYASCFICLIVSLQYINSPNYSLQEKGNNYIFPLIISIILSLWLGNRTHSGYYFGDTSNYALIYKLMDVNSFTIDWDKEWIWDWMMRYCKYIKLDATDFFILIEFGYTLTALWAIIKFTPNNPLIGMLFVWSSLMFYSYGINGIRNGLACHIILLALSFLLESKYIIGTLLCLIAFWTHKTSMLPIAAIVVGILFKDKAKYAIYVWLFSIPLSLVAGSAATSFFASLGFDDRMAEYTDANADMSMFSNSGFRWDFLFYSCFPVIMAWYVCVKRQISDNWYNVICIAYCLCNAFWVLVIRAAYSNRFAYLSWFIYPIVIAYPLINLPIWEDQDRKTGLILLAYSGFTFLMNVVYW